MKFWVVKHGNTTGIFTDSSEFKKAIVGVKRPIFKSFSNYRDANLWLRSEKSERKSDIIIEKSPQSNSVPVFIDYIILDGNCFIGWKWLLPSSSLVKTHQLHSLNNTQKLDGVLVKIYGIQHIIEDIDLCKGTEIVVISENTYLERTFKEYHDYSTSGVNLMNDKSAKKERWIRIMSINKILEERGLTMRFMTAPKKFNTEFQDFKSEISKQQQTIEVKEITFIDELDDNEEII